VAGRVALVLVIACAATARAGAALEVGASVTVGERVALQVDARNVGDGSVSAVAPAVDYAGRSEHGESVAELAPGAQHTWTFDLPRPTEPGSIPAVIHVRYAGDDGHRASVPVVAIVSTPGLLPVPEVRATLTTSPVTRFARAVLLLENPLSAPVHGRVVVVLPDGLTIEPESQPAEVARDGRSEVPLVLQNEGQAAGTVVPVFALFEYDLDGRRHLIVASTRAEVAGGRPPLSPLVVGGSALGLALALLALASRVASRRAAQDPHRSS
jgi:hypothetical protein